MSRYSDAVAIQGGACNPIAIVNSLVRGIEEIKVENGGAILPTNAILQDPTLRLMVHQLAYIFKSHDHFDQIGTEYFDMMVECEKKGSMIAVDDEVLWRAIEVFGDHDQAKRWFYSPCADLDGSYPVFLARSPVTAGVVLDALVSIEKKFTGEK